MWTRPRDLRIRTVLLLAFAYELAFASQSLHEAPAKESEAAAMSAAELQAEVEAAFQIEWCRNDFLRELSAIAGKARVKSLWQVGWIIGHQAGLEAAKSLHG